MQRYYGEKSEYPESIDLPKDTTEWTSVNWCTFWYNYSVLSDNNWVKNQKFILSTCLESKWNAIKAQNDWWPDNTLFEVWKF